MYINVLYLSDISIQTIYISNAHLSHVAAAAKSLQSCPTLCNPIDGGYCIR